MSNIFGGPKAGVTGGADESRAVPKGDAVGSYNSYLDAQKAVDYLADQQFPVQLVSIVGNELKMVERVTGRLTYPRVALSGAASGMWFGLFVGVMLSFFSETGGYFSIITSVLMGAAFFMLFGIVTYAMQRGKRDFTSTSQVVATNYDVVVAFEAAHEARRLLHQLPMTQHDAAAPGFQQHYDQHQPHQPAARSSPARTSPAPSSSPASRGRAQCRSVPRAGATRTGSGPPTPASRRPRASPRRRNRSRPAPPASATRTCRTAGRSTASASPTHSRDQRRTSPAGTPRARTAGSASGRQRTREGRRI